MMSCLQISADDTKQKRTQFADSKLIKQHFTCTSIDPIALH